MNMTLSLPLISLLSASKAGVAQQQPAGSNVKHGAVLYSENCASCHGANLIGQPSWPKREQKIQEMRTQALYTKGNERE